jgi:hypothetical protein
MSILGGTNGYIEKENDYLLLAYTNEEIVSDEQYKAWWSGFADIQAVPGLSEGIRLVVDADQRVGENPSWKYLVAYGFSGDAAKMKKAVSLHTVQGDSALWFYEAVADIVNKPWNEEDKEEHIFMALTTPKPGRHDDFDAWYNNEHVPDVVSTETYRSGRRFRLASISGPDAKWEYVSFYRFVGPALAMHQSLTDAEHGEHCGYDHDYLGVTDALYEDHGAWIYSAL